MQEPPPANARWYTYDALHRLTRLDQAGQSGGNVVAEKRVDFAYNATSTASHASGDSQTRPSTTRPRERPHPGEHYRELKGEAIANQERGGVQCLRQEAG